MTGAGGLELAEPNAPGRNPHLRPVTEGELKKTQFYFNFFFFKCRTRHGEVVNVVFPFHSIPSHSPFNSYFSPSQAKTNACLVLLGFTAPRGSSTAALLGSTALRKLGSVFTLVLLAPTTPPTA